MTIIDAGGGTLDVSTYARKMSSNDEYEEITAAQCELTVHSSPEWINLTAFVAYFKGSIFVTRAAERYLDGTPSSS